MTTYVALLRAVNVGGHASLPMAGLRDSLAGLGYANARTYLQSGNAVFDAASGSLQEHAAAIALRIERDFAPRVGVLVLDADDVARVVAANPFTTLDRLTAEDRLAADPGVDERSLHVTFLFGEAGEAEFGVASEVAYSAAYKAAFAKMILPAAEGERAAFVGTPVLATPVVYLHLPHGYGQTKLTNIYFERTLGAAATTRNWRTVRALAEMGAGTA
jgi:uncharacterized protein (DUF1697 family)